MWQVVGKSIKLQTVVRNRSSMHPCASRSAAGCRARSEMRYAAFVGTQIAYRRWQVDRANAAPAQAHYRFRIEIERRIQRWPCISRRNGSTDTRGSRTKNRRCPSTGFQVGPTVGNPAPLTRKCRRTGIEYRQTEHHRIGVGLRAGRIRESVAGCWPSESMHSAWVNPCRAASSSLRNTAAPLPRFCGGSSTGRSPSRPVSASCRSVPSVLPIDHYPDRSTVAARRARCRTPWGRVVAKSVFRWVGGGCSWFHLVGGAGVRQTWQTPRKRSRSARPRSTIAMTTCLKSKASLPDRSKASRLLEVLLQVGCGGRCGGFGLDAAPELGA